MPHIHPGGEIRPAPTEDAETPPTIRPTCAFDCLHLRQAIRDRRARLAAIETSMVAACERDAARGLPHGVRIDDRETWDKSTWDRYLAAAIRCEPNYMPAMLRILNEIEQLERLMQLPPRSSVIAA